MEHTEKFLKAGYADGIVTPPIGYSIPGYFKGRSATGTINELYVRALAFDNGKTKAIYFTCDALSVTVPGATAIKKLVSETHGIPEENIFIHATHSHTAFAIEGMNGDYYRVTDTTQAFNSRVHHMFCDCAGFAIQDLKPCTMKIARGNIDNVGFIRRYEMKDGSFTTNPAFGNPNILRPSGTQDTSLQLVRIIREEGKEIILVNFGTHPDTLGGCRYFTDWPGYVCEFVNHFFEDNVHTVMINGCQGNSNHWDKRRPTDFDVKGIEKAKRMARIISGEVFKIYDSAEEICGSEIHGFTELARIGQNPHKPEEEELALQCRKMYRELGDSSHPDLVKFRAETGMSVPKANRIYNNMNGPEFYDVTMHGLQIGNLSFIGIPGEPFCEIGMRIKENSKMDMTIVSCITNGSNGYFPTKEAFAVEGGYERNSSKFAHNCEDVLVEAALKIIQKMKN